MQKPYQILIVSLLLLVTFTLCLLNTKKGHNWGGDFSLYIHQAKSIVEGNSSQLVKTNAYIVENSTSHTFSPTAYPWGFPLLLAPFYAVFNLDYTVFKIVEAFFLIAAFFILFLTFRSGKKLNFKNCLFFILIIAFSDVYIKATNSILSGIPFLFFSYLGIYLMQLFFKKPTKNTWVLSISIGFVLFFSFSIRTEGIGLFVALFMGQIHHLFSNRKKTALYNTKHLLLLVPYLSAFLFYILLKELLPSGFTSHFNYQHLVNWDTSMLNIDQYYLWLKVNMFGNFGIPYLLNTILFISLLGFIYRIKKDIILTSYFFFLLALFIIWPFRELRYLYSVYPLILYFLIQGLDCIYKLTKKNIFANYFGLFILCACVTTNFIKTYSETLKNYVREPITLYGPETSESKELFSYIIKNTEEEDLIGFFKPRVMHFYTNRTSLALFNNLEEIKAKATYYVETKRIGNYFQIPIGKRYNKNKLPFKIVFTNKEFNIYKIEKKL